jgi:hypothetical protein
MGAEKRSSVVNRSKPLSLSCAVAMNRMLAVSANKSVYVLRMIFSSRTRVLILLNKLCKQTC